MLKSIILHRQFCRHSSSLFRPSYGAFIDGEEISGENFFEVSAPATAEHLCRVLSAESEVVDKAVKSCHKSFQSGVWSRADVRVRAKVLQLIADNLRKEIPKLAKYSLQL